MSEAESKSAVVTEDETGANGEATPPSLTQPLHPAADHGLTAALAAGGTRREWLTGRFQAYLALSKPRIIELLLVTTVPTMILAAHGIPNIWLVLNTLIGGTLSAASANAFNCYLDRDIDRLMKRTQHRPLVTGELTDRQALAFSWIAGLVSIGWLWATTNWFAAFLSAFAIFFYVVVYTMLLKRRTSQNIVWGGIAGCMPVFIGWAAVTASLSWESLILFGLIFLWTPPHYWPLAVKYRDDYSTADVPMLPVVRGRSVVGLQIVLYTWALVACSLLLIPVGGMGWLYTVTAVLSGGWFMWQTHALYSESLRGDGSRSMTVFHGSIAYLSLLFLAVAVDPLLYLPL
ncbi:heme o synthase [Pseudoclavibacter sp. 13-3]|uniref:heme o synthase n=1 Tax=Pseudoclavibacter sp. 13-3 TaxID=2901228 RepID=UPI001E471F10|nr:heme o synthase [Pseudoclavibacter sp. 13-3]MCD7101926.1 heme o synthase [Pseudoclavibacter sp. 13-3]